MKGQLRLFCLILAASFSGVFCSELLYRSTAFREAAARLCGRGHLVAIANGKGVYDKDLDAGGLLTASDATAFENLRRVAQDEAVAAATVDREFSLLRAQFGDDEVFARALLASGFSTPTLRERLADQVRSLQWLEKQITAEKTATEKECRDFFEAHRAIFLQPVRFRVSHVFLAAPIDTPPETVDAKGEQIQALALRLASGESLPALAAEASEDEATKSRGGDLGFFSSARMPREFLTEVEKLGLGQKSDPFQSHLGFHIVEMTEIKPARMMNFDEVREEISLALANERRALITGRLADMLSGSTSASN